MFFNIYISHIFSDLLQIEITQGEDIVGGEALAVGLVDILRLPGAHMDLRLVRIAEVPDHEDVALVAVAGGVPVLEDGDAIDVVDGGMLHNGDIVEGHLDILVAVEGSL